MTVHHLDGGVKTVQRVGIDGVHPGKFAEPRDVARFSSRSTKADSPRLGDELLARTSEARRGRVKAVQRLGKRENFFEAVLPHRKKLQEKFPLRLGRDSSTARLLDRRRCEAWYAHQHKKPMAVKKTIA